MSKVKHPLRKKKATKRLGRVYLDHAATTPMDKRVITAMEHVYKKTYWNPGSIAHEGTEAKNILKASRASIAALLGAQPGQIYFTHGGTDSINRAIQGVVSRVRETTPALTPHIIASAIEHPAVLETIEALVGQKKCTATVLGVAGDGLVNPTELKNALRPETILVSIQYANNEIGVVQPIPALAKIIRHWRKEHSSLYPLFHTDAIQAANYLDLHVDRLGVDFLSLSGSKIYGPKHAGLLYVRRRDTITPITYGGGQEGAIVPGTEDVAQAAGLAEACTLARSNFEKEAVRLRKLQQTLFAKLAPISGITINGNTSERLPNNIHVSVLGIESERLVLELDANGFAVSSKSACKTDREGASHVLDAIRQNKDTKLTGGDVRITLGRSTKKSDLVQFIKKFQKIVDRVRKEKI